MSDLFSPARREFRLFDASKMRFIPKVRSSMTESERAAGDEYFARSRCGHLQWRIAVENADREVGEDENQVQRVRTYRVKR